jgi:hypothetical protein
MSALDSIKTIAVQLLAFGFWLLAFGFWPLAVGFQIKSTFIRHGGAESAFRLYGDLLFDCPPCQDSCRPFQ